MLPLSSRSPLGRAGLIAGAAGFSLLLAACAGATGTTPSSSGPATGADQGGVERAAAAIKPFEDGPSPFNVTEPLRERPVGARFVYVQCGVPACAQLGEGLQEASDALGAELTIIPAGGNAASIASAFSSAVQMEPDAIFNPSLDTILWSSQYEQAVAAEIPVIAWSLAQPTNGPEFTKLLLNPSDYEQLAQLTANYVVAKSNGTAKIVYYQDPNFTNLKPAADAFVAEVEANCPGCTVELQDAPFQQIGTELPGRVVSYLQQHPDTTWVATAYGSQMTGIPQALSSAGLLDKVSTISQVGDPNNFSYISDGRQTADLALSLPILAWSAVDSAAKAITGQEDPDEKLGDTGLMNTMVPIQFITDDGITWPLDEQYPGYSDYQERFKTLWGVN